MSLAPQILFAERFEGDLLGFCCDCLSPVSMKFKPELGQAHRTQVWLATSDESAATVSGKYYFRQNLRDSDPLQGISNDKSDCSTCVGWFQAHLYTDR
jgi:hypothetical protein